MADALILRSPDALPGELRPLLDAAPWLCGPRWWRAVIAAGLPAGARPLFALGGEPGRPAALLPLLEDRRGRLASLSTLYTVRWQPLLAPADPAAIADAGQALGRACRAWPVLRWDTLDPDLPGLAPLLAGLHRAGYRTASYRHVANWHETVPEGGWPAYLAARPGALRETIRRKQARAERLSGLSIALAATPEEVERAIPAYREVYRRSWKQPEPYPEFDAALLRAAAACGVLRLATLARDGTPLAAQYWVVDRGTATVLKLAHDGAARDLSPGTLLTAWMIRRLIAEEAVRELDFGRGDDPYKRLWTGRRRQLVGLVLADPRRPAGAAALARQWAGQAARRLRGA